MESEPFRIPKVMTQEHFYDTALCSYSQMGVTEKKTPTSLLVGESVLQLGPATLAAKLSLPDKPVGGEDGAIARSRH